MEVIGGVGKSMKNTKIFPFERNHYYYGKLLSVDDFNLEQRYNSSKHRMNHMFLSGSGVVCGMNVINIGEQSISVESGCAIDPFGREMIIDVPVMKKLQMIDGFEQATSRGENYIYLCIEYAEKGNDTVYNMASMGGTQDHTEYNKITESYRLFVTNQEPAENILEGKSLYEDTRTLYMRNGISIKQTMPRYVEIGKKAEMRIEIETREKNYVAFSYTLKLNGFTYQKEKSFTIHFDERLIKKTGNYCLTYELEPVAVAGYDASVMVEQNSFTLVIDQQVKVVNCDQKYQVEIVAGDIKEQMIADYYKLSMENIIEAARRRYIYLAKIYITKADETYLIERVVEIPFKQYVMNQVLLETINQVMRKEIRQLEQQVMALQTGEKTPSLDHKSEATGVQVVSGVYEMEFGLLGENRKKFFSPPIVHGLGLGYVTIVLALETKRNETVFGNGEIFQESYVDVDLAAQLDESTGSFIIGAMLRETVANRSIRIKWTAIRKLDDQVDEVLDRRISIRPSMLELYTRERAHLELCFSNIDEKEVTWHVQEGGGIVEDTNTYVAPNEKGVYEVMAQSVAYPEVKASIFAVVRER